MDGYVMSALATSDVLIDLQPLRAEHYHGLVAALQSTARPDMYFRCTCTFLCVKGCARNIHGLSHDGSAARKGNRTPRFSRYRSVTCLGILVGRRHCQCRGLVVLLPH